MDIVIMLGQLLLSISILVAVHEMGHLLAAKYFGMRVEKFSIGFPPTIWSFKKGDTVYALSAIPLGGFVKISGMIDESLDTEKMKAAPEPWEFRSKPAWQRLIVMLGGIIVNLIVGVIIFIGITFYYGDTYISKDVINETGGFMVGPIGEKIGLKDGDKIVEVNGHDFDYCEDLIDINNLLADNASYTVERNGETITIPIPANFIQSFNEEGGRANFLDFRRKPVVDSIKEGSLAERIGLKKGDVFTNVNNVPVTYWDDISKGMANASDDSIRFTILRGGSEQSFTENFKGQDAIGFYNAELPADIQERAVRQVSYGFFPSIPLGAERAFTTLSVQVKAFGKIFSGVLSARKSLSGPIGIMKAFGAVWDWQRFWQLTGVLSLVLAFMNLLPIPALDGGHVAFLGYEIISRRKPSDKFLENAQKVGMVFLLLLMVFIFYNDIMKWVS